MDSNIKVEIDSSPVKFDLRKRDEFVLEEDSPPSTLRMFRPKDIEIVEESDFSQVSEEMECNINSSPIKFKARKRDVVEEDLSTPRIFSAKDTNEDDEEEEESEQNDEYSENDESMITINPDDPEFWYFDSEDSDSHDEEVDSKNDEESSDSVEDETVGDPELDFIKPDVLGAPKPAMITANVISTYASDGLIYTELDNKIIIVTPAKHRVKEKGTLSYEDGTGVAFFGPSTGKNKTPRKFIACPLMTKENLF
uniref:Uncharacterized protein n=1 Tax=Panagrolaimus superbus TaxID=310955 RepID=A0A914Z611_9BILA